MYATVYASDYDLSAIRVINIHHLKAFKKNFARRDTHDVIKPKRLKIGENVPFVPLPPPPKKTDSSIDNKSWEISPYSLKKKKKKKKIFIVFSCIANDLVRQTYKYRAKRWLYRTKAKHIHVFWNLHWPIRVRGHRTANDRNFHQSVVDNIVVCLQCLPPSFPIVRKSYLSTCNIFDLLRVCRTRVC